MTAPEQTTPAHRPGTDDDIAGWYIGYRLADDPPETERRVLFMARRGFPVAEAIAVKRATQGRVGARQLLLVAESSREAADDPEALQALLWILRRRAGETTLPFGSLADIDVLSTWVEFCDSDGVVLDIPDPEPDPDMRELVTQLGLRVVDLLPYVEFRQLEATMAALAGANHAAAPPAEDETPGEGSAGSEQPAPAPRKPRTRKTPKTS